jgi:hypothetical protein
MCFFIIVLQKSLCKKLSVLRGFHLTATELRSYPTEAYITPRLQLRSTSHLVPIVTWHNRIILFILLLFYLSSQIVLTNVFQIYGTDQDIRFLVPYLCWATVRNGNSISASFTEDTIKTLDQRLFLLFFKQFGSCFGLFVIAG